MLSSFNNESMASNNDFQFAINGQPDNNNALNSYAANYLNAVKENRSIHGNYLDNSLSYDPHKEKKSVYNVVYDTDAYNPWGKPGGGAPKLDNNTGQLKTKIVGTLKWNLNGETESDREKRLQSYSMNSKPGSNQNLLLYKKNSDQPRQILPDKRDSTYNFNYQDPFMPKGSNSFQPQNSFLLESQSMYSTMPQTAPLNQAINYKPIPMFPNSNTSIDIYGSQSQNEFPKFPQTAPITMPQTNIKSINNGIMNSSVNSFELTPIEQEAQQRYDSKLGKSNSFSSGNLVSRPKGYVELNRISNKLYTDNQPTQDYPNHSFWFGRTGTFKKSNENLNTLHNAVPVYDARRKKLLDALENRSPRIPVQQNNIRVNNQNQMQYQQQPLMNQNVANNQNNMYQNQMQTANQMSMNSGIMLSPR